LETIPGVSVSTYDSDENKWELPAGIDIPELEIPGGFYGLYVDADESFMLWSLPTSEADSLGNDLFVSVSTGEGWSAPRSLGAAVNTDKDEISPFFDTNTGLLFFSTNGRGSGDDYDLYYTKRLSDDWQDWSLPVKADINSDSFDAYFFLSDDSTGYFSSNRGDSLTNIYVTNLIIESTPDEIIEEDTTEVPDQELEVIVETGGEERKGQGIRSMSRAELLDEETVIRFVYFEYDKYNITARYVEVLDDVASILDTYPDIYVKIEGHTDAVASDAYNQILSENRAASVKEWLVINGIDPDRVKTEGLGEREPYASNATEEGRAQNRRVEIFFREMK
jgi:outer membrane protein OmpA-like peptidoglycan-associated protein